jgi:Ca2+-binding RTX toxin-like protein
MLLSLPFRRGRRRHARRSPSVASVRSELLERRTLLTTFTVNSTVDAVDPVVGNGIAADADGGTTLRAAIQEANASAEPDIILLPAGTYTLTRNGTGEDSAFLGDLDLTGNLTIIGAGAENTIIDGGDLDRVFQVLGGANVTIVGVTIQNGTATNAAGIMNSGGLELIDSVVQDNVAEGADNSVGGGIGNSGGNLVLTRVTVQGNYAEINGGGLYNNGGTITAEDSTFQNNSAEGDGGGLSIFGGSFTMTGGLIDSNSATLDGGGLSQENAQTTLTDVTISNNVATEDGGGINLFGTGRVLVFDSVITSNQAGISGGGIRNLGSTFVAARSAVTDNSSVESGGGLNNDGGVSSVSGSLFQGNVSSLYGGGINNNGGSLNVLYSTFSGNQAVEGGGINTPTSSTTTIINATISENAATNNGGGLYSQGTTRVSNTIVAGNTADNLGPDVYGTFSTQGNNLIGAIGPASGFFNGSNGDQVGTTGSPIDPLLTSLQDNGGNTLSYALTIDSPAIDAGHASTSSTDQTGGSVLRDGDYDGVFATDIGAVEFFNQSATFTVDTTADTFDAALGDDLAEDEDGNVSLRSAIEESNWTAGEARIELPAGTYTLTRTGTDEDAAGTGDLDITDTLTIIGAGADQTIIDGGAIDRVFHILPGVTVTLIGVTIQNGSSTFGGGLYNEGGNVLLQDVVVTGNVATGLDYSNGGGLANNAGRLILDQVTVTGNTADLDGAGIYSFNGELHLINSSTVESNSAGRAGGGIATEGSSVTITDSTIAANTATDDGGGAAIGSAATVTINTSTIRDNSSGDFGGGIYSIESTVTLNESTVSGNSAVSSGGGVNTEYSSFRLYRSTVHSNSAEVDGGGLDNYQGNLLLSQSTVSGNTAGLNGGGIVNYSASTLELNSSTIADNSAAGFGGGVWSEGLLRTGNSIIARNSASNGSADINGTLFSLGTNLIGSKAGNSGAADGTNGDIVGTFADPVDPVLTALQDNGGPTLTHLPLYGSPAIEAGTDVTSFVTDARGRARINDGDFDAISRQDIGAVEFFGFTVTTTAEATVSFTRDGDRLIVGTAPGAGTDVVTNPLTSILADSVDQFRVIGSAESERIIASSPDALPSGGLAFVDETTDDSDTLTIGPGTASSIDWTFADEVIAGILIDETPVQFSNLESVTDFVTADTRSFAFLGSIDDLTVDDSSSAGDGLVTLTRGSLGSIEFLMPVSRITFSLGDGSDSLRVNSFDSTFTGSVFVDGGDGADLINLAAPSNDASVDGGAGNDTILSGGGNDTLRGSAGEDSIRGGAGDDMLFGGAQADELFGEDGNDYVRGQGSSADAVSGGAGDDTIDGGMGTDFLVEHITDSYTLSDAAATGLGNDTLVDIERARISANSADNLIDATAFSSDVSVGGGDGDDTILTGNGNDRLYGESGDDVLSSGSGNDAMFGGSGSDDLDGGDGNDILRGNGGSGDRLTGGAGNDIIDGGGGNDRIVESADADVTVTAIEMFGIGHDFIQNVETVAISGGASANLIDASAFDGMAVLEGLGGNDTLIGGAANDFLQGGSGNDLILGNDGNDLLRGHDGNDTLRGGNGNDTLEGGNGNDGLAGENGNDLVVGEMGDDSLLGQAGDDTLFGGGNDDSVIGGSGKDRVTGNAGDDRLAGGSFDSNGADAGDFINGNASEIDEVFRLIADWIEGG